MATISTALTFARELSQTDSNSLTDTLGIDFANAVSFKMRKMLIDKGIDACPVQEATLSLTSGTGTYLYPTDMFYVPKYVEINWFENPVTNNKYVEAQKVTESNLSPGAGVSWLRTNQPSANPLIDYRGDYYEIFPTPLSSFWNGTASVSAALRIFYYLAPTLYTTTGDTLTNPEGLDYVSFGTLIKATYDLSLGKTSEDEYEKKFAAEVGRLIHIIQGDGMSQTETRPLPLTGWEF